MTKLIPQAILIIVLFFGLWFSLNRVNWMVIFKVKQTTKATEEKLGDLLWETFNKSEEEIKDKKVVKRVDSILSAICKANDIDRKDIKLHIIKSDIVNAFSLPNGHLSVYSGLILAADNEAELSGVLCHELAHIEKNHVMKKLVNEVGLSVLVSMTTGKAGAGTASQLLKFLTSSAYGRNLEKEADITAVDYLVQSKISPKPFADFLYKLAGALPGEDENISWISTHPDSKERAEYIIDYGSEKIVKTTPVLSPGGWDKLKRSVEEE